jgi:choline dehydrogenase
MNSSRRPAEGLAVRPNHLAAETDQRTIVRRVQECRRILATPHLQRFIESEFLPGPAVQTDQQLPYFCPLARRHGLSPDQHLQDGKHPMAVVDPELRVHGVERLRVADASIRPTVVSGNTNAATIMIGERVADMAREIAPRCLKELGITKIFA